MGIVGSLLEDKGRLVRLFEGPFVVLAPIMPLQSWYNIITNVVHYIEIKTSQLDHAKRFKRRIETCLCRCLPRLPFLGSMPQYIVSKKIKEHCQLFYDIARLHLMVTINFWPYIPSTSQEIRFPKSNGVCRSSQEAKKKMTAWKNIFLTNFVGPTIFLTSNIFGQNYF